MTRLLKSSDLFNPKSDLIKKLKQKDLPSFELIFDMYASSFCTLIESITKNPESTNELMVKVFSTIYKTIDQFQENKSTLYIWMLTIARNIALESKSEDKYISRPHSQLGSFQDISGLQQLIEQLPDEYKTILHLSYFEGMNNEAISLKLQLPVEQIRSVKNKGLGMLSKLMGSTGAYNVVGSELVYVG